MTKIEVTLPDIKDVGFGIECETEPTPIRGNCMASGDDAFDEQCAVQIERALEDGNPWAWCSVKVTAEWRGLKGVDYLGCYSNLDANGGLDADTFEDMKLRAYGHLLSQIELLAI